MAKKTWSPNMSKKQDMAFDKAHGIKENSAEDKVLDSNLKVNKKGSKMAKLSTKDRKSLDKSQFAIPEKAPGSGSYPIPDAGHARDALARSSGKPEEGRVKAAVKRKFPGMTIDASKGPQMTTNNNGSKPTVKERVSAAMKKKK